MSQPSNSRASRTAVWNRSLAISVRHKPFLVEAKAAFHRAVGEVRPPFFPALVIRPVIDACFFGVGRHGAAGKVTRAGPRDPTGPKNTCSPLIQDYFPKKYNNYTKKPWGPVPNRLLFTAPRRPVWPATYLPARRWWRGSWQCGFGCFCLAHSRCPPPGRLLSGWP